MLPEFIVRITNIFDIGSFLIATDTDLMATTIGNYVPDGSLSGILDFIF